MISFLAFSIPATSLNLTLMSLVDSIFILFLLEVIPFITESGLILVKIQYVMAIPMKGVASINVSQKASYGEYGLSKGLILIQSICCLFYWAFSSPSRIRLGFWVSKTMVLFFSISNPIESNIFSRKLSCFYSLRTTIISLSLNLLAWTLISLISLILDWISLSER